MLWFRLGAIISLVLSLLLSLAIGIACFVMCINRGPGHDMSSTPYYNGTLCFYILIIITEIGMLTSSVFGFVIACRIWKNNNQLDHSLRYLFALWLAILGISTVITFVLGILGLVKYREPQEEIIALYEIFVKYTQDIKFVGSFEKFQRENSCCGINGPADWYYAQFNEGNQAALGMGMMGMDMSYMGVGSPSTGKCHLTPPTVPLGCGRKLLELIHFTMTIYCSLLVLQSTCAIASAALGWYCFFYWIEKEVIIIPEDEVSNLIVIEPESSTTTYYSSSKSTMLPSSWSGLLYSANGSQYTRPATSRYSSFYHHHQPSTTGDHYGGSRYTYKNESFYSPNSRRSVASNNATQGGRGPYAHAQYHNSRHNEEVSMNSSRYVGGEGRRSNIQQHGHSHHHQQHNKKHSFNHQLHMQEQALGGKVLAEMHVNHARDPDPLNTYIDTARAKKGHREHHATIALVKNTKPSKPKVILSKHGQTGHLAQDILEMSGGAAAAKSLIDDVNLPVGHDPGLTHRRSGEVGYANKLHKANRKKSQLDHPDPDHPGHGPVHKLRNGIVSAPSIDGSQAQSIMDNVFHPKNKAPPSKHAIKPHDVQENTRHHHKQEKEKHHHQHHHDHNSSHHFNHHRSYSHHHDNSGRSIVHHHHHHNHDHHHHNHQPHHNGSYNGSLQTHVLFRNPNSVD